MICRRYTIFRYSINIIMRPWSRLFGSKLRLSSPPTARPAASPLDRSEFDPRSIIRTINPDQGDPKSTSVLSVIHLETSTILQ